MRYLLFFLTVFLLVSCQEETSKVTDSEDYNRFLSVQPPKTTSKYFELWNSKIEPDSLQLLSFGHVASEYNRYFQDTGDIQYLKKAEQALTKATEIANINKSGYFRALARNYIAQHRFKEAFQMAENALQSGGGLKETHSLLFDVHMELGNYKSAEKYLDSIRDMSDFGFLIRAAKWSDYKGDLDTTIRFMEKALAKAESAKSKRLMLWSYTNLADYYGHAGRIEGAYHHYIKALQLDAQNAYAKKGIAWIVFSHERNPQEALRILDSVTHHHKSPDHFLLKAEIADFMGDDELKAQNLDIYYSLVQQPGYGDMYNGTNVIFYSEHLQAPEKALDLARKEVENRPTPESYGYLAYAYVLNGKIRKALQVVDEHILGKTFEPQILLNAAKVYKANSEHQKAKALKQELVGAIYELGPLSEIEIDRL
ncbi:MAG: hypothetical protein CMH48_12705 [Muricauda sp.]|nr:hypothetical protein [Allomuricauda sp.]MAU26818.1 hypothetical protein [Allomuricauda sp.]MBC31689.1 hypothetical protein [Allomuricauda sp.]